MPPKKQKVAERQSADLILTTQPRSRRTTRSQVQAPSTQEVLSQKRGSGFFNATSRHQDEEAGERRLMGGSLLKNILALGDTLGVKTGVHIEADQLLFLETVRVLAIVPDVAVVPAKDVFEKIMSGIQETKSLRVIIASFRLLHDLNLRHPQVDLKSVATATDKVYELVNNKEQVWSPFETATQNALGQKPSTKVSMDLYLLLESIADDLDGGQSLKKRGISRSDTVTRNEDPLTRMVQLLTLKWLVSLLVSDFQARRQAFGGDETKLYLVEGSLIQRLLMGPYCRKIKDLLENLLRIMARPDKLDDLEGGHAEVEIETGESSDKPAPHVASVDLTATVTPSANYIAETDFGHLAATLLFMILELDAFKALGDSRIGVSRRGSPIGSLVDTLLDILLYRKALLKPLLQTEHNPVLKFKLILMYFVHRAPGRSKDELRGFSTAKDMFDWISLNSSTLVRSIYPHEIQLLLANAFQASLETHVGNEVLLREVCTSFQAAFDNMCASYQKVFKRGFEDVHHSTRGALVIAHAILSS